MTPQFGMCAGRTSELRNIYFWLPIKTDQRADNKHQVLTIRQPHNWPLWQGQAADIDRSPLALEPILNPAAQNLCDKAAHHRPERVSSELHSHLIGWYQRGFGMR